MDVTGIPLRPYRGAPIRGGEHLASYSSLLPNPNTNTIHPDLSLLTDEQKGVSRPYPHAHPLRGWGGSQFGARVGRGARAGLRVRIAIPQSFVRHTSLKMGE